MNRDIALRKAAKEMLTAIYTNMKSTGEAGGACCGYERYSSTITFNGNQLAEWMDVLRMSGIIVP